MAGPERSRIAKLYSSEPIPRRGAVTGTLSTLALLYKARLRSQPIQELLALFGIAAGVALLFAVQIANKSVTGSFEQLAEGVAGKASLEVAARSPEGMDQGIAKRARKAPYVKGAAPVLERRIAVKGPKGRRPLTLVGVDERLSRFGGRLVKRFNRRGQTLSELGVYLPESAAKAVGVGAGESLTLEVGERTLKAPLAGVLGEKEIGPLAESPVAVAPLELAQEIAKMPRRISRVLAVPDPGKSAEATASLKRIAHNRLNVRPSDTEAKLLSEAAKPDRQSTALFSAISLVVGLLFAYNAMLLTVNQRRLLLAALRMQGASRRLVLQTLIFDALVLGAVASLLGLILGNLLSRYVVGDVPAFLASAFAIGGQRIITAQTILLSIGGGLGATLAAAARPAMDVYSANPIDATHPEDPEHAQAHSPARTTILLWTGLGLVAATSVVVVAYPDTTAVGAGALTIGMVLTLPAIVGAMLRVAKKVTRRTGSAPAYIAVTELSTAATRATALAAIGAVAVFGILTLVGSSGDLKRGLNRLSANVFGNADVWVTSGRSENAHGTLRFQHRTIARRLKQVPSVRSIRVFRAAYYDLGNRRLWLVGAPRGDRNLVAPSEIVSGEAEAANLRLREGGWAAIASSVAEGHAGRDDRSVVLPTASGERRFRLAATITNYSWVPGAIVVNAEDFRRYWETDEATALEVSMRSGVTPEAGAHAVGSALRGFPALKVQSVTARRMETAEITRQGLSRLDQIARLVLVAGVLAVVAATLASIWARRRRLGSLRALGMKRRSLYGTLLLETGLVLAVGCLIGLVFGFFGQALAARYLQLSNGFSAPFSLAWELGVQTLVVAMAIGVAATVLPARLVTRVSPSLTFSPE